MPAGAVTFGGAATDAASVGVIAAETQLATATYLALVKPTTFTANRVIYQKAGNIRVLRYSSTAGDLQFAFQRATTATSYITSSQPLLTLNQYYLVAVTVDTGQAQVVHIKTAPYTAGAFGALTEATYGTATAGVGTINADNGSASVWGNNAGGSAVWQGDMAAGAVFASVLSDADILSWANKPRQVVNGTAAVQMRLFGMGGADAIDYAGNAAAAMTGGVQAAGPGILTPVDDARTLVAAAGSNTVLFSVHDARMNFLPSAWTDAINAINGRAAGLSLAQAVGASQPAISTGAERINFAGTKSMATGQDTRLSYDVGSSLFVFAIGKFTSGPVVAIAADPTTKASFPYSAIQVSGGNLKSVVKPAAAGTAEFNPDTGTAQDTTMRAVWMGKRVMTATESWLAGTMGRAFAEHANATAATTVVGGSKTAVGAFNGANGTFELVYLCYHLGEVLPAFLTAFYALAISLGASSDNSCTGRVCFIGDSNYQGTQTSNGLTALDGSGTTSQLALAANATTGPRPLTFTARGVDAAEPHRYIRGYGGQGMGNLSGSTGNDWERDVALGSIGLVNGRYVIVTGLMFGGAVVQHWTLAQWKTNMAAIYAQSKTLSVPTWFVLHTGQDGGGSGTSTFGFYNAASPSTVLSSDGQGMVDFLAELRAHPTLYCDQVIDTALNLSVAQIQRAVSLACDDVTYYAADRIHMKDAMAQITGPYIRTQLDLSNAFNDPLWPPSAGLARMGFKLSLGF